MMKFLTCNGIMMPAALSYIISEIRKPASCEIHLRTKAPEEYLKNKNTSMGFLSSFSKLSI